MFEKIKKLLFATKEKEVMSNEDALKETLSKIRNEDECRLKKLFEDMPKLDSKLTINITSDIMKDEAINEFFKDMWEREILERTISLQGREIMAAMQPSTYNFKDFDFQCELHKAASSRNVDDINKVESLLKNGANPNEQSYTGNTPLHKAISIENIPAIKLLLVYGANLFLKNKEGRTPYDLLQGQTLIEDLISNDTEISVKRRVQVLNHNLNKLDKKGLSRWLGDLDAYKVIEGKNDTAIQKGYPVSSLKELCIQKILGCVEII